MGESGSAAIDVALADVASGERVVWTLARGRWSSHPALRGAGGGPMPGGPVRLGSRMYLPVIDAFAEPWKLSVHVLTGGVWGVADGLLNRGVGNAQGVLTAGGGAVWASWQENEQRADRLFNTRMYAQRVAPRVGEATEVWAGTSIGPGSIETAEAIGRRWILYMPAANGRSALSVAVEPLR